MCPTAYVVTARRVVLENIQGIITAHLYSAVREQDGLPGNVLHIDEAAIASAFATSAT
jgi:hypothetical protein